MGCGWLGMPLAVSLVKDGYHVHGTTTSKRKMEVLKREAIDPFQIALFEDQIKGDISNFLKRLDILIVNVPPKLRSKNKENYVQKIQLLHKEVKKAEIQKVIFVSSTAVYGDVKGVVTEKTTPLPSTISGIQLLEAENVFFNDKNLESTILRFGGLIGRNRHPINMLSGRQNLANGNDPVNLIHLNDCIGIIKSIISNSWWNEILNGVYPEHPSKQEYYTKKANKLKLQPPHYETNSIEKGKEISSNTLLNVKKFHFTTTI